MPDKPDQAAFDALLNARLQAVAEAAVKPVKREDPEYLALKMTFSPSRGDVGGALCLIFHGATGDIVEEQLWMTRPYVQRALKPSRDWRSFIKMFPQLGNYDKSVCDKLTILMPELISQQDRMDLFVEGKSAVKRHLLRVEGQVRKGFERSTMCFFDMASDVELVTRSDLEGAKILEPVPDPDAPAAEGDQKEGEQKDGEDATPERSVVKCLPIVDPVRGRSASQIVPGDILEVGLEEDAAGAGALVHEFLEETGQAPTFPVEEVSRREEKIYIYLHISDEIQGLMTLTKDLRLKTKRSQEPSGHHKNMADTIFLFVGLGVALIALLLALRFIFV